ncbi:MAG: hypothetical protein WCR52_05450 [Bacteroidota bacterium]|uniref:TOTE conflict system archaeo-eukaryotic primase domain-containing protein n=1 Tax=Runella sp. TaxID=1960881 RepID=UPI0030189FE9
MFFVARSVLVGFTFGNNFPQYLYRRHKIGGGTFQNFPDKSYLPLSNEQISKHLNGNQLVGIYLLLHDNTSSFLAADFDDEHWEQECLLFIKSCGDHGITAYLERSRSGAGGHVWIFFEKPTEALINFLKDEFNITNSEFYVKQKSGKSTWDTPRFFQIISRNGA